MKNEIFLQSQRGQSLIEVLIGVLIAVLLLGSAATLVNTTLTVSRQNKYLQGAWFVNQLAMDTAGAIAEANWNTVRTFIPIGYFSVDVELYNQCQAQAISPAGDPVQQTVNCSISLAMCDQASYPHEQLDAFYKIELDSIPYYICIDVEPVYRNASNDQFIPTGTSNEEDWSVTKISVKSRWGDQAQFQTIPLVRYVTRNENEILHQTDWSGGPGQAGIGVVKNKFDTSTNIDYSTTPGTITIQ